MLVGRQSPDGGGPGTSRHPSVRMGLLASGGSPTGMFSPRLGSDLEDRGTWFCSHHSSLSLQGSCTGIKRRKENKTREVETNQRGTDRHCRSPMLPTCHIKGAGAPWTTGWFRGYSQESHGPPTSQGRPALDANPKRKTNTHESMQIGECTVEYIGEGKARLPRRRMPAGWCRHEPRPQEAGISGPTPSVWAAHRDFLPQRTGRREKAVYDGQVSPTRPQPGGQDQPLWQQAPWTVCGLDEGVSSLGSCPPTPITPV